MTKPGKSSPKNSKNSGTSLNSLEGKTARATFWSATKTACPACASTEALILLREISGEKVWKGEGSRSYQSWVPALYSDSWTAVETGWPQAAPAGQMHKRPTARQDEGEQ